MKVVLRVNILSRTAIFELQQTFSEWFCELVENLSNRSLPFSPVKNSAQILEVKSRNIG